MISSSTKGGVTAPEWERLREELKAWVAQTGRQVEIADDLNVSRGMVHDWLNGRRVPSVERFFQLQAFLKKQRRRGQKD